MSDRPGSHEARTLADQLREQAVALRRGAGFHLAADVCEKAAAALEALERELAEAHRENARLEFEREEGRSDYGSAGN